MDTYRIINEIKFWGCLVMANLIDNKFSAGVLILIAVVLLILNTIHDRN